MSIEFNIIFSNRLEVLADAMAELAASPYPSAKTNPLEPEIILIQSKGMQRWLSMAIAERQGICANIDFPFPNALLETLYGQVVGPLPQQQVFDPTVLTFRIMAMLPQLVGEPAFAPIRHYLKAGDSSRKQFQLASKIADVFDQYQIYRPEMILGWERGQIEEDLSVDAWQPILWQRLNRQNNSLHRAEIQKKLVKALIQKRGKIERLPQRISVFGISHLPPFHIEVMAALSQCIPVYLFLMNPCRHYWGDILSDQQLVRSRVKGSLPDLNLSQDLHIERGNRLLASWGGQGKQFFNLIHQLDGQMVELFEEKVPQNLLAQVQQDILNLDDPSEQEESNILNGVEDSSIQIHACHSPMREVEVLHDQLLDLFEKDTSIQPRDVLVMTTDIGTYAPYIHAVFGTAGHRDLSVPYSVADQGMPKESRLIEGFLRLLDFYQSRFPASQVMALLANDPIRQCIGLDESDLIKIEAWLENANVRWGWSATHLRTQKLPRFEQNTWRQSLDRLILGYAMATDGQTMFENLLPQEGVDASDGHILGAFVGFMEKLYRQLGDLPSKATMSQWHLRLVTMIDGFFLVDESTAHDIQLLREAVDAMAKNASAAEYTRPIPFEVVRDCLASMLDQISFDAGFMAGGITFCSILPMRSIPAKVICLLGLGYDKFPQDIRDPAFNLASANPRPGDRSKRDDDKYLFLEALISARQVFYLSYVGRNVQDNSPIPPSVVIDELLEYVGEGYGIDASQILTVHPLQSFSRRYFDNRHPKLFSYSQENMEASQAMVHQKKAPLFFSSPLDEPDPDWRHVTLEQLNTFFANPARYLLEKRLAVYLQHKMPAMEDQENFNLDGLDRYKIKQKLLNIHLEGRDLSDSYPIIRASGILPHGTVGKVLFEQLESEVDQFLKTLALHLPKQDPQDHVIDLELEPFRLSGTLNHVYGDKRVIYRLARTRPRDLISLFVDHLALSMGTGADQPPVTSLLVCQDGLWQLAPISRSEPLLYGYLDLFWQGLQAPVLFFTNTSYEYAMQRNKGKSAKLAMGAALKKWQGNPPYVDGESKDPYYQLCFTDTDPFTGNFEELALKTFQPLLDAVSQL